MWSLDEARGVGEATVLPRCRCRMRLVRLEATWAAGNSWGMSWGEQAIGMGRQALWEGLPNVQRACPLVRSRQGLLVHVMGEAGVSFHVCAGLVCRCRVVHIGVKTRPCAMAGWGTAGGA